MTSAHERHTAPKSPGFLAGYRPSPKLYDELLSSPGKPRAHWEPFVNSLDSRGRADFISRRETARRILQEHGVTYNVYGDAKGLERPWDLDMVPLLIPPGEWTFLEAGLAQRTRLLNLILADIYGPQRLFKDGLLPPALLQANSAFLPPCHGLSAPQNIFLAFHGVDLARTANGSWWVLADRTQAPSGAGYALENRMVLSRALPEEFRQCRVQRLAGFFQAQRDTLRSLAPHHRDHPNVVLLTPGPYNETYFEHAFFARYLGFPLVEGADLTVRDRRVFIKTLEGLQPVDVILRRVDDTFCDPLELMAESTLGVPGLLEAARAGNVAIANALGSGAVETPALMPFLPGLCRHLLGEDLKLPSVPTWWCGQPVEFGQVLGRLGDLVVKRAFRNGKSEPIFANQLSNLQREALEAAMRAAPYDFVAQEQLALSTAPVWIENRLEPRPVVLRTYVCAAGQGFSVMPGGLTRMSTASNQLVVSMQRGGGSKDTWVLTDGPVSQVTLLRPDTHIVRLERAAAEVPSRVADNLFWLGRYAERLEDTVRILRRVLMRLVGEETGSEDTPEFTALVHLLVSLDLLPQGFHERFRMAQVEKEVLQLIYQVHRLGTVREVLGRLKHIAFVVRVRFSADTWRIVNKLQVDARPGSGRLAIEAVALLNALIVDLAAFSGMEMENMTRGHGWRFLDIGRRLERAINIITLVQGGLSVQNEGLPVLEPILEIADSVMTYRRRYFAQPQLPAVLDLLLADETNPRSLAFQVHALAEHAAHLPGEADGPRREAEQLAAIGKVLAGAEFQSLAEGLASGQSGEPGALLTDLAAALRAFSDTLTHHYFSHADTRVN